MYPAEGQHRSSCRVHHRPVYTYTNIGLRMIDDASLGSLSTMRLHSALLLRTTLGPSSSRVRPPWEIGTVLKLTLHSLSRVPQIRRIYRLYSPRLKNFLRTALRAMGMIRS